MPQCPNYLPMPRKNTTLNHSFHYISHLIKIQQINDGRPHNAICAVLHRSAVNNQSKTELIERNEWINMMNSDREKGLAKRKATLGTEYVEASLNNADDFSRFQKAMTAWCWGWVG